jgi:hypothetical protein
LGAPCNGTAKGDSITLKRSLTVGNSPMLISLPVFSLHLGAPRPLAAMVQRLTPAANKCQVYFTPKRVKET